MKLKINKEVLEKFPKLNIGVVVAKNIDNKGKDEKITKLLEEIEGLIKAELTKEKTKREYHTSVEILVKKIVSGKKINLVNKIADLYRYISLKYLMPIGGFDSDQVIKSIELAVSDGADFLIPAGKGKKEKAEKGEIVYMDDIGILCRKWNWKYAYKTKITEKTKNAVIFVDGIPPVTKKEVEKVLSELKDLINMFCKGEVSSFILNKDEPNREF